MSDAGGAIAESYAYDVFGRPRVMTVRTQYTSDVSDPSDKSDLSDGRNPYGFRTADAETFANTLICLINQASYLIGRQIRRLEQSFVTEGGFSEKLYRVRSQARRGQ